MEDTEAREDTVGGIMADMEAGVDIMVGIIEGTEAGGITRAITPIGDSDFIGDFR
jgi:hypothetical protein